MLSNSKLHPVRPSPAARLITIEAVLFCGMLGVCLRAPSGPSTALAADAPPAREQPLAPNAIVPGVGWKNVQVGMTREALLRTLGKPDNDPSSKWLKWADKHIECTFYTGSPVVSEVIFNQGFQGSLANGVEVGSRDSIVKLCGEPEHTEYRPSGQKQYEYATKGMLFWTNHGRVTQIVVFKPIAPVVQKKPTSAPRAAALSAPVAAAGNYWETYRRWEGFFKGKYGVARNPEEAQKCLAILVNGAYVAVFLPAHGFAPRTPSEFLSALANDPVLKSAPTGLGGGSFFRTRAQNGMLIGSFLTARPDATRKAL